MQNWINNHFNTLNQLLLNTSVTDISGQTKTLAAGFETYINAVKSIRKNKNKLIFIGNGGSAGIASHMATDYSKNGHMPSTTFSDASMITCLSNDYGYEFVFSKQIEYHAKPGDVLIAISSSGKSKNILNAVSAARDAGCQVMTFSGFTAKNPLSLVGDINFFVDSHEYGFVEVGHLALIHAMLDNIIASDQAAKNSHKEKTLEMA